MVENAKITIVVHFFLNSKTLTYVINYVGCKTLTEIFVVCLLKRYKIYI